MSDSYHLFEVSWEVCHKVGGVHTSVASKARTLSEHVGERHIVVGPWLLTRNLQADVFEATKPEQLRPSERKLLAIGHELKIPVHWGRWKIPGRPRTLLVEFSGLNTQKNEILGELWDEYGVDSLTGDWDYVEPVLFGHAAGIILSAWWQRHLKPLGGKAVAQIHDWHAASCLLHLKSKAPDIASVFVSHATALGRSLSSHHASQGVDEVSGINAKNAHVLAHEYGVRAPHSLESAACREARVLGAVSDLVASECERCHSRTPEYVLPNGLDVDAFACHGSPDSRRRTSERLHSLIARFLGKETKGAALIGITGRYEYHNKGFDVALDALWRLNQMEGRSAIALILVPSGNSGIRKDVELRLQGQAPQGDASHKGVCTHNLFHPETDEILKRCSELGLVNHPSSRIQVVYVPAYLNGNDGFFDLPCEEVISGLDLTCFPSFYEPWGYTPQESLALGVPTITTDRAGFGQWAESEGLGPDHGITVLRRNDQPLDSVAELLAGHLNEFLDSSFERDELSQTCRETAQRTNWSDLIKSYIQAYDAALAGAISRHPQAFQSPVGSEVVMPLPAQKTTGRPHLRHFEVSATLSEPLAGLRELAQNYWWSWQTEGEAIFRELSPIRWERCDCNPVRFLREIFPQDLEAKAEDESYVKRLNLLLQQFHEYMGKMDEAWKPDPAHRISRKNPVVYFCAEFGLHQSLRIYSGGLGMLAGDHLKSASDINLPLIAVGLFYKHGYMKQRVTGSGDQLALDVKNDPHHLPMQLVRDTDGDPITVTVNMPGSPVTIQAWEVKIGRVSLYLLDVDREDNAAEYRTVTGNLYGGDSEMRLMQEIILGRGGARWLAKMGIEPSVYHMNEGHAAFLGLERAAALIRDEGLTFREAQIAVRASTLFTTHTPVPAGHDCFSEELMRRYFSDAPDWAGMPWEEFYCLGTVAGESGEFNMTHLALRFADFANGVSKLHGEVSKELLHNFWPTLLRNEVPINSVTNGVHLPTWTSPRLSAMMGVSDRSVVGEDFARASNDLDPKALFEFKREAKEAMLSDIRARIERASVEKRDPPSLTKKILDGLVPDALVIGFARRFVPYKRAHLIFTDQEMLRNIMSQVDKPILILMAGKAHPKDGPGQGILKNIFELCRSDEFIGKVVFVEDYDQDLARHMVRGVDIWLNNPIRPLEASGTSGMKVSANGGLNLSISDGWWEEGYNGKNGWVIGDGSAYEDEGLQNQVEASDMYRLLEEEIMPSYFDRRTDGLPLEWIEMMKNNLATIPPMFNTDRMVHEYADKAYAPLSANFFELSSRKFVRDTAAEVQRLKEAFCEIAVIETRVSDLSKLRVGDTVSVHVTVDLGSLAQEDVLIEFVLGNAADEADLHHMSVVPFQSDAEGEAGHQFSASQIVERSGNYAYGIRIRPRIDPVGVDVGRELMLWA